MHVGAHAHQGTVLCPHKREQAWQSPTAGQAGMLAIEAPCRERDWHGSRPLPAKLASSSLI